MKLICLAAAVCYFALTAMVHAVLTPGPTAAPPPANVTIVAGR